MSAENPTPQEDQVSVREKKIAELLEPGEIFTGNWAIEPIPYTIGPFRDEPSAHEHFRNLQNSGRYETVRMISAFDRDGNVLPEDRGIVVKPKSQEPAQ